MRSMRKTIYERDGIRVNCVCPGFTATGMTTSMIKNFQEKGGITQSAENVADIILGAAVADDVHGKAFYVEGARGWEFEDGFYKQMPAWLGAEPTTDLRRNAELVTGVSIIGAIWNVSSSSGRS